MDDTGVRPVAAYFSNLSIVTESFLWNRKEMQNAVGHVLFEPFRVSVGIEQYL